MDATHIKREELEPQRTAKTRSTHTLRRWILLVFLAWSQAPAAIVPAGFHAETVVTNINAATALTIGPDGTVFYTEQTGAVRVWKAGRLLATPAIDLAERLDTYWERGLIGLTLHPDFPRTPHVFVVYVAKSPYTHHVISRFTMSDNLIDPASERILLEGDDQSTLGGGVPAGHQGGPICFGGDGKLYIGLGEQTAGEPSQQLTTLQGKILRINPDGTPPHDNPFYEKTTGKYRSIWAIGIRNPFGLASEPGTGRLFCTDAGSSAFEEVNMIVAGGNYGWPHAEGLSPNPAYINPVHSYPQSVGRSICGGAFYPRSPSAEHPEGFFPEQWRGAFLFVDWASHWLKTLDPDAPTHVSTLARGLNAPVSVQVAPDGSIFVLNRGTLWRDGNKFTANSGSLVRIRYTGSKPAVATDRPRPPPLPAKLSDSGLFACITPLQPGPDFRPVEINHAPWQPGVQTRRWMSLPLGQSIRAADPWEFPVGAIVVQHHQLESVGAADQTGPPFETHVFWLTGPRTARAAAYRWTADGLDATLVEESEIIPLQNNRFWLSPGFEESVNLDTLITGFQFPLSTRQLNRHVPHPDQTGPVNQLELWKDRGWIRGLPNDLAALPRLVALNEHSAPLELRIRSYLDVNCSSCHQPGGFSRGMFDARLRTPLTDQNLLDGPLMAGDLGVAGARVILPGHPEKSILLQRLKRTDFFRMPPTTVNDEPQPIVPLLETWIKQTEHAAK